MLEQEFNQEINESKRGYINDYISGLRVKETPEEIEAVQVFSKQLVEDYNYPKTYIQTRPQFRVKRSPSDKTKSYPVDIAVFSEENKSEDTISFIVECKKKSRKDGRSQLENYLSFSKAWGGVWFNGEERLFLRKIEGNGRVEFEEIPNIPKFGERLEDIGKFKRKDLQPTHNLKATFKTIRNYLAANAIGVTRDEVLAQQLINIIFCKIYDEKFTSPDDTVSFRAGFGEEPEKVKSRILQIFQNVKLKYKEVMDSTDDITLDSKSTRYVVGELQNYSLIETDRDSLADAFEIFIGKALKGDKGQFFTPRNVVKLIVEILNPTENDTVIDPACGSGGFLVESLRYIWRNLEVSRKKLNWNDANIQEEKMETAISKIRGLEKDNFLAKVTKAYMAILGDGKGGVFCQDSLDVPDNWQDVTKAKITMNSFSFVMTNPPFGSTINVVGEDKLKQYDFGYKWDRKKYKKTNQLKIKENPQILFIERCLQLLKNGGKMGIVLPETYLHAPSVKYIIKSLEEKHNIFAIVDLPHNTFRPHCNAKCVVLFLQKNTKQQEKITMGIVREMGHNHQGKPIYRFDDNSKQLTNEIWDDTSLVLEEFKNPMNSNNKYVFCVNKKDIKNSLYIPRYYWNKNIENLEIEAKKQNCELISIDTLIKEDVIRYFKGHGAPPSAYKGTGDVFYVRAGDIMDWHIYKNPTSSVPKEIYLKGIKGKVKLQKEDILFVKEGSYRVGDVALLSDQDTDVFLNHHTLVLRVSNNKNKWGIDPYYLLYLLSSGITRQQLYNKIMIDTTLPNIGDRWKELKLPLLKDNKKRENIKKELRDLFGETNKIQKKINEFKQKNC